MHAIGADLIHTEGAFIKNAAVVIDGDRIVSVASRDEVPPQAELEDWGSVAVVPGSVNAHGHAFQNLFKGFADDRVFASWRDDVLYPFSERLDGNAIYTGALFAFAEALLAGVTTTVDFFYLHDASNDNAKEVIRAAADIGVRLVLARAFYDPLARTSAPARYREPPEDAARRCKELSDEHSGDAMVAVQPAPHSLHAATPDTVGIALDLAAGLGAPCHLHLAEASYERDQVVQRYGATPVRLLAKEGLLSERLVTVHTVWVDEEEIELLADAGAGVVHCPGANAFLGDGIALIPEMLRRGLCVALGPDGGCANNRQSVFEEMRIASLVAKARLTDGSALDAPTAFALGTANGGRLLGLPVGTIAPGQHADLVALDLEDLSLHPLDTIDRQIVHSMQATAIKKVMVGGQGVVQDGRLTRFDLGEVRRRVAEVTKGWARP